MTTGATTTNEIYNSLLSIMEGIEPIAKNNENKSQNYEFRGVEDVYGVLNPMLIANKVMLIPEVMNHNITEYTAKSGALMFRAITTMKYTFTSCIDGSNVSIIMTGEGMDSGDKATPKSISMAFKYMAFQLFCIPVEEGVDSENDSHEVKSTQAKTDAGQQSDKQEPENWLNKTNKDGSLTKEWVALIKAIDEGRITSISDVRKYYKVSKIVATEIEKELKP